MQEVRVNAIKAQGQEVTVMLADKIPAELAQVVGAILSTDATMNEESGYLVKTVAIGEGMFNEPLQMGEYLDWQNGGCIHIDIDKVCEGAVLKDFPMMDLRFFAFHGLLQVLSHEAIHARNAWMYPEEYGYSKDHYSREEMIACHEATEAKAKELMDHLMYRTLDIFSIDVDRNDLEFMVVPLKQAIHKHGMDHVGEYFYEDCIYMDKQGGIATTWRTFLGRTGLATEEVRDLLPLPDLITEPKEKEMEAGADPAGQDFAAVQEASEEPAVPSFADYMDHRESDRDFDPSVLDEQVEEPAVQPEVNAQQQAQMKPEEQVAPAPPAENAGGKVIPQDELRKMFESVIFRCYQHIFNKCGWDSQGNFKNPTGVLEPVYIGDIAHHDLIVENHSVDEHGRFRTYKNPGAYLKGLIASKSGLPMFHIVIQVGQQRVARRLVPQNPNKTDNAGNLKWTAKAVRNGEMLAWVLDPDADGAKFTYKLNNNKIVKL